MMAENHVVVGATSGIASAICKELAGQGANLILLGRNADELEKMSADLQIRYEVDVHIVEFQATEFRLHADVARRCHDLADGDLTAVYICHGNLIAQQESQESSDLMLSSLEVNMTSFVTICEPFAEILETQGYGRLIGISSVAGDRGRQSNYIYGAAKAGVTAYLSGLRNRLFHKGVHVMTVKPGFVATKMTAGLLDPKSPMVATPEKVARDIVRASKRRKNILYTPRRWCLIMTIIESIPEFIFKRMKM